MFGPSEAFSFDAVYTFIVAINQLLHSGTELSGIRGQVLLEEMHRVRFTGVSGEVSFDDNGDRFATYDLMSTQSDGREIVSASFDSLTLSFTFQNELVWADGSTQDLPPQELYACDPGFYKDELSRQCKKCPKGMMCSGGPIAEALCPRGTFAPDIGMVNCSFCPKGTFASDAGSIECIPCPPGTEAPNEGMEMCDRCSSGFYMPASGSFQCLPCGKKQITPETGSTKESDCRCPENSFMCGDHGCIPCPMGLYCPEGLGLPQQKAGFWADPNGTDAGAEGARSCDFSVLRCRDPFECPGGPMGICAKGRTGQACNNCKANHYPVGSLCRSCSEGDALPAILLILLFLCILFFISGSRWDPSQVSCSSWVFNTTQCGSWKNVYHFSVMEPDA